MFSAKNKISIFNEESTGNFFVEIISGLRYFWMCVLPMGFPNDVDNFHTLTNFNSENQIWNYNG